MGVQIPFLRNKNPVTPRLYYYATRLIQVYSNLDQRLGVSGDKILKEKQNKNLQTIKIQFVKSLLKESNIAASRVF